MSRLVEHYVRHRPLLAQLSRFGLIGLIAAIIHFSIVIALVQLNLCPPLIANIFAFMIAFQVSYWGHRCWTFRGTLTRHRTAILKLLSVQATSFAANETLFYIFLSLHYPYPIALLFTLTILPIFTFLSSKLWVFK